MIHRLAVGIVAVFLLNGCMGGIGGGDPPFKNPPKKDTGTTDDPYAPCTDPASCGCTEDELVCTGDPDRGTVCKCFNLWDCSQNPKKCEQDQQFPPGGGQWTCTWSTEAYVCTGGQGEGKPSGGNGWECQPSGTGWTCSKPPPNPTNTPEGTAVWNCHLEDGKLVCDRDDGQKQDSGQQQQDAGGPGEDAGVHTYDGGSVEPDSGQPPPPPPPLQEGNCGDGIDNDGDGKTDCKDEDCPQCTPEICPPGEECCDGVDNNGDGRVDEGNVCGNVAEPCPPNAVQACDCYCGVHRRCQADGTWGPCKVDGDNTCALAQITSQSQCGFGSYCDFGQCVGGFILFGECKKHTDCPAGKVCDLGMCITDHYFPCP